MANPQITDAHLRVAHSINEAIMLRDFTKRQRKILDLILRLSWGCGKKTALVPKQRDFEVIGIRETHISTELTWLATSKVISINGCEYAFNKDFDQWQVSRVKPFQPEKLAELVSFNLNHTHQNGKVFSKELTEMVSDNLPKEEVPTYQNSKVVTRDLALAKENIKKIINKETYSKNDIEFLDSFSMCHQTVYRIALALRKEFKCNEANKIRYRQELSKFGIEVK